MDRPDARKQHGRDVPVVGGIAVLLSYLLSLKLRGLGGNLAEAYIPVGLMLIVGMIDDARGMSARIKLALQIIAAWVLVRTTGFSLSSLPLPGVSGGLPLGFLSVPITVLVFVGIMNAINMSDGADGLAGGYIFLALLFFVIIATLNARPLALLLLLGLLSSTLGFLACNARRPGLSRAKIFLGDAGALSLGMLLCWFGVLLNRGKLPHMPSSLMLYAVALPVLDMITVCTRRLLQGKNPMRADRTHLHHFLHIKGLSVELSVPLLWLLQLFIGALGLGMWQKGASEGTLIGVLVIILVLKMLYLRVWEALEPEQSKH